VLTGFNIIIINNVKIMTMKKFVVLMLTVCMGILIPLQLSGQAKALTFSVVGGISKSSIVGESESWKDPIGGQVGVIVSLSNFSESLSLKAEANVSMQGAKWEEDIDGLVKGRTNLLYLNVPVVLKYRFKNGIFAEAGIQPGLLLMAKDKYNGSTVDYKDYVNTFDLGIPVGIGYEFKKRYAIGLRVIQGITNINSQDAAKDYNFVAALRFIYTFEPK
jgi:hypothetical protein